MRKYARFLTGLVVILGVLMSMTTCLDPTLYPEEFKNIKIGVDISGQVDVTIQGKAVLILENCSQTIKVTQVEIRQDLPDNGENKENKIVDDRGRVVVPLVGYGDGKKPYKPESGKSKATYLEPAQERYSVIIKWEVNGVPGEEDLDLDFLLTKSSDVKTIHIFRDPDGDVDISEDDDIPDPDDNTVSVDLTNVTPRKKPTAGTPRKNHPAHRDDTVIPTPPEEVLEEEDTEGTAPATVTEKQQDKLGFCIVENMTHSQLINKVEFEGSGFYELFTVEPGNLNSQTLKSGQWKATLWYNNYTESKSTNVVIFLMNSPQAVSSNYLYFYHNTRGDYSISTKWPPVPYDVDEDDMIPPEDDEHHGSGLIKIINNSQGAVREVNVYSYTDYATRVVGNYMSYIYTDYIPAVPIQHGNTGFINVVGDAEFPILAENYLVVVDLDTAEGGATVKRLGWIKDTVFTITINEKDVLTAGNNVDVGLGQIGSTVAVMNQTTTGDYEIVGMVIKSVDDTRTRQFNDSDQEWNVGDLDHGGPVGKNEFAKVLVKENSNFFLRENDKFNATLLVRNNENGGIREVTPDPSGMGFFLWSTQPKVIIQTIYLKNADIEAAPEPQKYVTLRFYFQDGADAIRQVWFNEVAYPSGWETDMDPCRNPQSTTLPHNTGAGLLKKYTGHTGIQAATEQKHYNASATEATFIKNVLSATGADKYFYVDFGKYVSYDWREVQLPVPPDGRGWYIYFKTYYKWYIGYTHPGTSSPPANKHFKFFIDPHALMKTADEPLPENRYYIYVDSNKTKPRALEENESGRSATRVIPIAHTQVKDLTSIMKTPPAAVGGIRYLTHDAN